MGYANVVDMYLCTFAKSLIENERPATYVMKIKRYTTGRGYVSGVVLKCVIIIIMIIYNNNIHYCMHTCKTGYYSGCGYYKTGVERVCTE